MNKQVLLLATFALLVAACGKNADATKAAPPPNLDVPPIDIGNGGQSQVSGRRISIAEFADRSEELTRILRESTDNRVHSVRLLVDYNGAYYFSMRTNERGFQRIRNQVRERYAGLTTADQNHTRILLQGTGGFVLGSLIPFELNTGETCAAVSIAPTNLRRFPVKFTACEESFEGDRRDRDNRRNERRNRRDRRRPW